MTAIIMKELRKVGLFTAALVLSCLVAPREAAAAAEKSGEAAAPPPVRVLLGDKVRVSDPDNDPLSYHWRQLEGPKVTIADQTKLKTWFVPIAPGRYVFELRVSDGKSAAVRRFTKLVTPPNRAPTAEAGARQTVELGQMIQLDGGLSEDPDHDRIKGWEWRQIQGPKLKLRKKDLTERQLRFKPEKSGLYVFELRVSDGRLWSAPDRVEVLVRRPNSPPDIVVEGDAGEERVQLPVRKPAVKKGVLPVPVVGPDRVITLGEKIILDGSKSYDPQGGQVEYFWWRQVKSDAPIIRPLIQDKSSAVAGRRDMFACPRWYCTPKEPGRYEFRLEVGVGKRMKTSRPVICTVVGKNQAPTAEIHAAKTAWTAGEVVTLDGSASHDPEGEALKYDWHWSKKGRYPKEFIAAAPHLLRFRAPVGEYGIELVVTDKRGARSKPARLSVKVAPPNRPPTVTVPAKLTGRIGQPCTVKAVASDPENDRVQVEWTVVEPKNLRLPPAMLKNPRLVFVPRKAGLYRFSVVARETRKDGGVSAPAFVQIAVLREKNLPPTADLRGPKEVDVGQRVTLSGRASFDPEGKALTYLWRQIKGPKAPITAPDKSANRRRFTPTEPGDYQFSLTVSDGENTSRPAVWTVRVNKRNSRPEAFISPPKKREVFVGQELTFDGSGSRDADRGDKLTYHWRQLSGPRADLLGKNAPKLLVTPLKIGEKPERLVVELVVNDGLEDSKPATAAVVVLRRNRPPVAVVEGPRDAVVGHRVQLSGEKSRDPDPQKGDELTYFWQQVDNHAPRLDLSRRQLNKSRLKFKPRRPGTYVFRLTVKDGQGAASAPAEWSVTVSAVNKPPSAVVFLSNHKTDKPFRSGAEVVLSAKGSRDPEGRPLTFEWRQVSGPDLVVPVTTKETITLRPRRPGRYVFEVRAFDGAVRSEPARVKFRVAGPNGKPVARIAEVGRVSAGDLVALDASNSFDPDGDRLTEYRWELTAAPPGVATKLNASKRKMRRFNLRLPLKGKYVFRLRVFDGKDWSDPVEKTIVAGDFNIPPTATPDESELYAEGGEQVELSGKASRDPDGVPRAKLTFRWRQVEGRRVKKPRPEGPYYRFIAPEVKKAETLRFQLRVHDGKDESKPAEVLVHLLPPGTLPRAVVAKENLRVPMADENKHYRWEDREVVKFDGSLSTPRGKLHYQWQQVQGEDLTNRADELTKPVFGLVVYNPGRYRFKLRVQNVENLYWSRPAYVNVIVYNPNRPAVEPARKPEQAAPKTAPKQPGPGAGEVAALVKALGASKTEERTRAAIKLQKLGEACVPALIEALENGTREGADAAQKTAAKEAAVVLRHIADEDAGGMNAEKWRLWWNKKQRTRTGEPGR